MIKKDIAEFIWIGKQTIIWFFKFKKYLKEVIASVKA
jgi:hypothetical protein